jgi:hypothetical protein
MQALGNDKFAMHRHLSSAGRAVDSYRASELDLLAHKWGSDRTLIAKPAGGSLGDGIKTFDSLEHLWLKQEYGLSLNNYMIQPRLDLRQPIPDLRASQIKPNASETATDVRELNAKADRDREIRWHTFVTTIGGQLTAEAYPILRTSEPSSGVMQNHVWHELDASCYAEGTPLAEVRASICGLALAIARDQNVANFYGAADMAYAPELADPYIIQEFNARGPRLWAGASLARLAFVSQLAAMYRENRALGINIGNII